MYYYRSSILRFYRIEFRMGQLILAKFYTLRAIRLIELPFSSQLLNLNVQTRIQ